MAADLRAVAERIAALFAQVDPESLLDGAVFEYIAGLVMDAEGDEQIMEAICAFSPAFEALPKSVSMKHVKRLVAPAAESGSGTPAASATGMTAAAAAVLQPTVSTSSVSVAAPAPATATGAPSSARAPAATAGASARAPPKLQRLKLEAIATIEQAVQHTLETLDVDPGLAEYLVGVVSEEDYSVDSIVELLSSYSPTASSSAVQTAAEWLFKAMKHIRTRATSTTGTPRASAEDAVRASLAAERDKLVAAQVRGTPPAAAAPAPAPAPARSTVIATPELRFLQELQPAFSLDSLATALLECNGDLDAAAARITAPDAIKKEQARLAALAEQAAAAEEREIENRKKEEAARTSVIQRYAEHVDTSDKTYRPLATVGNDYGHVNRVKTKGPQLRFLNNQVVATKGEKYIIEKPPEDPSTFVSIRVKSKGKRGPGFKMT